MVPTRLAPGPGHTHVRWTFDPLRITNARLNLNRLGGRSCTYLVNYYGEMGGINEGLPFDRLLLDWRLDDPTVVQRARGARLDGSHQGVLLVNTVNIDTDSGSEGEILESLDRMRSELQGAFSMGYHLFGVSDTAFMLVKP